MSQPEIRLTIDRNPPDPNKVGKLTQAAADAKVVSEQVANRRKQIHQQAKVDLVGGGQSSEPQEIDQPPVRENLESIEFTAPNGQVIEYGPRHDISLVDRIARLYSGRDPTVSEFRLTRILMGIRSVDGKPPVTIVDEITRTKLANQIGDENIDLLMYYDRLNWPPLQQSELPVIKKRLRT
jgi:hypothetical protein